MHVVRSWISCRISYITSITISVTTIENMCIYHTYICCIGFITVYTGIRVVALAALSSLAVLGVVTLTPPGASATAGLSSRRPSISVLHFCVYFDKVSHFITSNCLTELMIFMCVYAYMNVLYGIPQYHVFIVHINSITAFIVYILTFYSMFYAFDAIMFYCTLSEMTIIKMIKQSYIFSFQIIHLKISSGKWQPQCVKLSTSILMSMFQMAHCQTLWQLFHSIVFYDRPSRRRLPISPPIRELVSRISNSPTLAYILGDH